MRYHLFLKFVRKLVEIAQTFCLNLAVRRHMSTSVPGTTLSKLMICYIPKYVFSLLFLGVPSSSAGAPLVFVTPCVKSRFVTRVIFCIQD